MKIKFIFPILFFLLLVSCQNDIPSNSKENNIIIPEEKIALFDGIAVNKEDREIDISTSTNEESEKLRKRYNVSYSAYYNNAYLGEYEGKIEERGLDYFWQVHFDETIPEFTVFLSNNKNPYPRKIESICSDFSPVFDSILNTINIKFQVNSKMKEMCRIDLDGDGKNEYLAFIVDEEKYFFTNYLIDSNFNIISYLTLFHEYYEEFEELVTYYNLFDSIELIDIDNDGIMEIFVPYPIYEGFMFHVFSYKNGSFDGNAINECSLKP